MPDATPQNAPLRWSHTAGRWLASGEVCNCEWCFEDVVLDLLPTPEGERSMEWFQ